MVRERERDLSFLVDTCWVRMRVRCKKVLTVRAIVGSLFLATQQISQEPQDKLGHCLDASERSLELYC